ncbi:hypothetical protein WDW89_14355 [Deltaproteobacteria bacterium TL4]
MTRLIGTLILMLGLNYAAVCAQEKKIQPGTNPQAAVTQSAEDVLYGPFAPIILLKDYVEDVSVTEDNIMVKLTPPHRDQIITIRISDAERSQYRYWLNNGKTDFQVKVYRGGKRQGYTYLIRTAAGFIEYWEGNTLFLHLARLQE